ncbi:SpoIIE family protein phosphatase [Dehalococcoidia bacterium]|nr:SpoIIE family protein phosphatase [Dehalococcoidia bacterium]
MDLGIATRPKRGQSINGDAYFVGEYDGKVLLAVIDGVGHGEEANRAARRAIAFLENYRQPGLETLIQGCHRELRGTRGGVISLALMNKGNSTLSHAGIGNIESRIITEDNRMVHLISMNGVIGHNLRKVKEFQYPYHPGDTMVMFSDGISSRFMTDLVREGIPSPLNPLVDLPAVAQRILEKHSKADDATVLLARLW